MNAIYQPVAFQFYQPMLASPRDPAMLAQHEVAEREATILFTDLRGFTRLSEEYRDSPARLLKVVNEHFSVVVKALRSCGGVIEKFVGDGVLATFGTREAMPDSAQRAVAAAMGIIGANERLNRRRKHEWGFELQVGIGIAAGKVVIGQVGPPERSEVGVLGDPVNVAQRLVATARPGQILMACDVYQQLAADLRLDLVGGLAVKGRVGRVEAYSIDFLHGATAHDS
jgi:adenylate cyclase